MTKQRPVLAIIGFRSGTGGIGRVMTTLINALIARGIIVDLFIPSLDHPDLEAIDGEARPRKIDITNPKRAAASFDAYLKASSPNAILSNKDQSNCLLQSYLPEIARPVIAFRIGTNVPEKLKRSNRLTAPWKRQQLAHLYRKADILIGNSSGVSAALHQMLGREPPHQQVGPTITTIWNPVDQETIAKMASAPPAHPWITDKQAPLIVSVGRLVRHKNYGLLLRALSRLTSSLDARLIICGTGSKQAQLSALSRRLGIADRIDFVGYQSNPFPYVAAADLFVCPSLFEGANNALMEALSLGTPCISTDCPSGARDILEDGKLGALVPMHDPNALAAAMQSTLAHPPDRARLRASAERFNPKKVAEHYAEALGLALGPLKPLSCSREESSPIK